MPADGPYPTRMVTCESNRNVNDGRSLHRYTAYYRVRPVLLLMESKADVVLYYH